MQNELKSSRFLVIGGSSGIGLAVARRAVECGANLTIASRKRDKLDAALAFIGNGATGRQLDATDQTEVDVFFAKNEPWDHVVVSAAQTTSGPVRQLSVSEARETMDSKFWGAYHVARSARIRSSGSLCFVSGFRSVRPSKTTVLQGAVNAAIEALARGLALELAPIRVNVVSPGMIETPLWESMGDSERKAMFASTAERLPVKRIGEAVDVAKAVIFLASNSFATGSTVLVDGGATIA